jgi:hypothetical protein
MRKIRQRVLTYLIIGALTSMGFPNLSQAQEPRVQEAQSEKEVVVDGSEADIPEAVPSSAVNLLAQRLGSVEVEAAVPVVRPGSKHNGVGSLNTSKYLNPLYRPDLSAFSLGDFRLPVVPQPQTSSRKKSKAGGLIIGLIGLGLIGGGAYLAATSKPVEHFIPAMTTCTGVFPNQRCFTTPRRSLGKTINGGRYGGFGLIVLGMGVAVAGFGKM